MKKEKFNPIYFSCDFLEFSIENFKDLPFSKKYNFTFNLDFDNSSQGFIYFEEFKKTLSYRKATVKNYKEALIFSISIDDISFDIFYFLKGGLNQAKINVKHKIGFYSTFFVLENIGKLNFSILDFYNTYFKNKNNKLNRLDLCLDVANDFEFLEKTFFKGISFFSALGRDKKNPLFNETYYIKNPLSSKNRFYLIRIYDKISDTFKKGKNYLYSFLKDYEDVRRIELELRADGCKMIIEPIEYILGNKNYILEKIFKRFIYIRQNCNTDYFETLECFKNVGLLETLRIREVKKSINLGDYYAKNKQIPKKYLSTGSGYIKKLYSVAGFKGLFDLFFKGYIEYEKKVIERSNYGYKFFEELLKYFLENNFNKNEILRIFGNYKKNARNPILKLNKK